MKKMTMKVLMLLGVVVLGLAFTSCDDSDEKKKPEIAKTALLGKWVLEKIVTDGVAKNAFFECKTKKDYVEILDNGKAKSITHGMDGMKCIVTDTDEYQWTLNGDVFQFMDKSESEIYKIKSLTETSMILELIKAIKNGKEVLQDTNGDGKQDKVVRYFVKMK